jgi:hypothetical protein
VSELRLESWTMPAASLGAASPLPPLRAVPDMHAGAAAPWLPEEMRANMARGAVHSYLPYTMQDAYDRERRPRAFRVAVLENEVLRAAFLLEYGGRLWSLVHKPSGRELLHVNPVFQPANLAIRNAWFSGGVEWNCGIIGHSPHTCSPLFAAHLERPDGTPVLRLYEWERLRQLPYQIDAYLPDTSPVLFVRVRVVNPHAQVVPMYWWSNIAVPQTAETRVLAPADAAYSFGYGDEGLAVVSIPRVQRTDVTYPVHLDRSADFFFDIPEQQRPWITALDGSGRGLFHVSTARLLGRKLFCWGCGRGGNNWQDFLSTPGHPYLEIQAGLARTQLEYLEMDAHADWSWLEAYGLLEADPAAIHGTDWPRAVHEVERSIEQVIAAPALEAEYQRSLTWIDRPPIDMLQHGSGWGALETLRRQSAGEDPFCSPALVFHEDSLGTEQTAWLGLLRTGRFEGYDGPPVSYLVQAKWRTLLETAAQHGKAEHWLAWLHLGVMRAHAGETEGARQAWERSLALQHTAWALRNLALLAAGRQQLEEAATLALEASRLEPGCLQLAIECGSALLAAHRPADWLAHLGMLGKEIRTHGRVRLLEGWAALDLADFERVERLLASDLVVADLREGDQSLSSLWLELHLRRLSATEKRPIDDALRARVEELFPVPVSLDFRMRHPPAGTR